MKHLIIEGMDGSGKDTLIRSLIPLFPDHTPHPRASDSLKGPLYNLTDWVEEHVPLMQVPQSPRFIYNRHPLVSELIYAPWRQINPGLSGGFLDEDWVNGYRRLAARDSILVICEPKYSTVVANLERQGPSAHMPGVYENAMALYTEYSLLLWPGMTVRYNYEIDTPETLAHTLKNRGA